MKYEQVIWDIVNDTRGYWWHAKSVFALIALIFLIMRAKPSSPSGYWTRYGMMVGLFAIGISSTLITAFGPVGDMILLSSYAGETCRRYLYDRRMGRHRPMNEKQAVARERETVRQEIIDKQVVNFALAAVEEKISRGN